MSELKKGLIITTSAQIICVRCNVVNEVYLESIDEAEEEADKFFSDEGWEMIDDKILCQHCVDKYRQVN